MFQSLNHGVMTAVLTSTVAVAVVTDAVQLVTEDEVSVLDKELGDDRLDADALQHRRAAHRFHVTVKLLRPAPSRSQ